ncbi:MAG: Uma2 family endonuclease [Chloroflexi bacterium]|nr:Uma2 family endonuclease [Chloroflexota bacterium]
MSEARAHIKLTGDDLLEIQAETGKSYELIDGTLVEMAPAGGLHGAIEFKIAFLLGAHARQHNLGQVLVGEVGFYVRGDVHTVRGADVAFIRAEKVPPEGLPSGFLHIVPDLVVEVVSPSDRSEALLEKVAEWLRFGVETVWLVYPSTRSVHVYTDLHGSRIFSGAERLEGSGALAGFSVPVQALFED